MSIFAGLAGCASHGRHIEKDSYALNSTRRNSRADRCWNPLFARFHRACDSTPLGYIRSRTAPVMRSMQKQIGTAWISKGVLAFMAQEFRRTLPNETGGVLVGYWMADSEGVVITDAVGPGPRATHDKTRFVPDWSYHLNYARISLDLRWKPEFRPHQFFLSGVFSVV
jgi:hypothetical protein